MRVDPISRLSARPRRQTQANNRQSTAHRGGHFFKSRFAGFFCCWTTPALGCRNVQPLARHNLRMDILLAAIASFFAGGVDAIVGGGGLILLPALFAIFPGAPPATVLGLNKGTSIWGTASATWQYTRRVQLRWYPLLAGAALALLGSFAGAWTVTQVSSDFLKKILPGVLLLVFIYTLARKDMGQTHAPRMEGRYEVLAVGLLGAVIGFYDGFFGPGTGSFFVFLLVRWLGYDFMHASASAKLLNTASNFAALSLFAWKGHVWWHVVAVTAVANVAGSLIGARLAMKHGSGFVRVFFMLVVGALLLKTASSAYF